MKASEFAFLLWGSILGFGLDTMQLLIDPQACVLHWYFFALALVCGFVSVLFFVAAINDALKGPKP